MVKYILLSFLIYFTPLLAQNYSVFQIPDSLLKNANYVKRYESVSVKLISSSKARIVHKYVYTILNSKGIEYGSLAEYYDSFKSIESITGELYNAVGDKLESVKKKDIADVSWGDGFSLYTDVRYKEHDFGHREFPYTVSYEIESLSDGLLSLPFWMPQERGGVSVMESNLLVSFSDNNPVRYKLHAIDKPDSTISKNGETLLSWSARNIPAKIEEPFQPAWFSILPGVALAPTYITLQGYSGQTDTWKNFGLFFYQLLEGRDQLPPVIVKKVHELTDGLSSTEEKVQVLYRYLQSSTRYISVQLGIGGWQPFDANFVSTKQYGDCKALSNYMIALLKEAGVESNYVIIGAGESVYPLEEDFPRNQANHVIVCVPNGKDSIWLECTNQYTSAGFNGSFTGNRKALLIKDDGGHVVHTTFYNSSDNKVFRNVDAVLDLNGKLKAVIKAKYSGQEQEDHFQLMHEYSESDRLNYLNKIFRISSYNIDSHIFSEKKGRIPVIEETLEISADHYAIFNGTRLFITPNQFNQMGARFLSDAQRLYPIQYNYSYLHYDTISIRIPDGYKVESMAKDVNLTSKYGHYSICFSFSVNKIEVYREYERNRFIAPSEEWSAFSQFLDEIYRSDRAKIVLIKK
jgi:transglutaminase-like putative cysteine protease